MTDDQVAAANVVFSLLTTCGLLVAAVSISWRAIRYIRAGRRLPVLLPRDWVLVVGILVPVLIGFVLRASNRADQFSHDPRWVYGSGSLITLAVLTFAGFELFVIERTRDGDEP